MIIDPTTYPDWDNLLLTSENSSFFHTAAWARVLFESYRYTPFYVTDIQDAKLKSLLPLMEVSSRITGRRGVSLPFTDAVPVIADTPVAFQDLFENAVRLGTQRCWKYIEMRPTGDLLRDKKPYAAFLNHTLFLQGTETDMFSKFRNSTRQNIRKAEKNNIQVDFSTSLQSVKAFFRLNCFTRKHHGLPPQPFRFFKTLHEHVLSKNFGVIVSGFFKKKMISSNIYFHYKNRVLYKYGANDRRFLHLRSSYLVMWEAIRHFLSKGFERLDFGRTDLQDAGLLQFKSGWAGREAPIDYYRYDPGASAFITSQAGMKTAYGLFRHMPVPLLQLIGNLLYRHVG